MADEENLSRLLMDEPTHAPDKQPKRVFAPTRDLTVQGITLVWVSHDYA